LVRSACSTAVSESGGDRRRAVGQVQNRRQCPMVPNQVPRSLANKRSTRMRASRSSLRAGAGRLTSSRNRRRSTRCYSPLRVSVARRLSLRIRTRSAGHE
jgi:hypothetical protein